MENSTILELQATESRATPEEIETAEQAFEEAHCEEM